VNGVPRLLPVRPLVKLPQPEAVVQQFDNAKKIAEQQQQLKLVEAYVEAVARQEFNASLDVAKTASLPEGRKLEIEALAGLDRIARALDALPPPAYKPVTQQHLDAITTGLHSVLTPAEAKDLAAQVRLDLCASQFLRGHCDRAASLLDRDVSADKAASLLRDIKALLTQEGTTEREVTAYECRQTDGPPNGLKTLLPRATARGWRPSIRDTETGLSPLDAVIPVRDKLIDHLRSAATSDRSRAAAEAQTVQFALSRFLQAYHDAGAGAAAHIQRLEGSQCQSLDAFEKLDVWLLVAHGADAEVIDASWKWQRDASRAMGAYCATSNISSPSAFIWSMPSARSMVQLPCELLSPAKTESKEDDHEP
jgi:hypothetical protein